MILRIPIQDALAPQSEMKHFMHERKKRACEENETVRNRAHAYFCLRLRLRLRDADSDRSLTHNIYIRSSVTILVFYVPAALSETPIIERYERRENVQIAPKIVQKSRFLSRSCKALTEIS